MDYSWFFDNIEIIVASFGGWVAITIIASKFLADRIADKMLVKWTSKENQKLEQLRSGITREHSIFMAILNSYSSSNQFSQSNRITAVQILWDNVLETRKLSDYTSFFFDFLLESEYNTVYDNETMMAGLNSLSLNDITDKIHQITENVEKFRPFLGENIWSLFVIYTILVGRVSVLLVKGRDKRDIKSWHKDEYIMNISTEIYDEKEMDVIISKKIGSFKYARELLEQKILFEMNKIISGELAAESDLSKAKKLSELIKIDPYSK